MTTNVSRRFGAALSTAVALLVAAVPSASLAAGLDYPRCVNYDACNAQGTQKDVLRCMYRQYQACARRAAQPDPNAREKSDRETWQDYNEAEARAERKIRQSPDTYQLGKPGWKGVPTLPPIEFENWPNQQPTVTYQHIRSSQTRFTCTPDLLKGSWADISNPDVTLTVTSSRLKVTGPDAVCLEAAKSYDTEICNFALEQGLDCKVITPICAMDCPRAVLIDEPAPTLRRGEGPCEWTFDVPTVILNRSGAKVVNTPCTAVLGFFVRGLETPGDVDDYLQARWQFGCLPGEDKLHNHWAVVPRSRINATLRVFRGSDIEYSPPAGK